MYFTDNTNGKLFRISADFQSTKEWGASSLTYPTRIREVGANFAVYDNSGINVIGKNGEINKIIKSFLKLEDFELLEGETMVANLAEAGSAGASYLVILDPTGKKIDSIGKTLFSDYPDLENRAFLEIKDGKLYVGYKYQPLFEVYEVKNRQLLRTFPINASIFPSLLALIQDKSFANPAPGVFKMPKFIAAFKVVSDRLYALLHTPNPVIVELTPEGKEIQRYILNETEAVDYFGFDVRTKNDTKQFFVGNVDRLGDSSIAVYEVDQ